MAGLKLEFGPIGRRLARVVRTGLADRRGAVAIFVAVGLIPMMLAIGTGVDLARGYMLRTKLISALDAAALAGGRNFFEDSRDQIVRDYFDANFPPGFMGATLTPLSVREIIETDQPERLEVRATATIPTAFMHLVGINDMDVDGTSEITRENFGLQVALVLDNTGSMNGTKISDLRVASRDLVDILFGAQKTSPHEKLSVAVVPYSVAVNVGNLGADYIDFTGLPAEYTYDPSNDKKWKGCVMARDTLTSLDPNPNVLDEGAWDMSVAGPIVGGKWKAYRYPHWYDNQYSFYSLPSPSNDWEQGKGPYGEIWPNPDTNPTKGNSYTGPNIGCPSEVLPLTNTFSTVDTYLQNNMIAWSRGGTLGNLGLVWGWRILDPGAPFPNTVPYNDPSTYKAVVMMTDGQNQAYGWPWKNWPDKDGDDCRSRPACESDDAPRSDFGAYGRLDDNTLGTTSKATARDRVNQRMEKICTAMKAGGVNGQDKITIYTVVFGSVATSTSGGAMDLRDLYTRCASDPAKAFMAPSGADLREAFRQIGEDLANLHISR